MNTPEPKPFVGRLLFDGGQVRESVQGEIGEDAPAAPGKKTYSGLLWCEWNRATIEVLGRQATLQTGGGLKARITFLSILDVEGRPRRRRHDRVPDGRLGHRGLVRFPLRV